MGTAVELSAPVLLVLGLFARFGAAALLVMTLTIQFLVYPGNWPEHLMWASILAYVLTRGPGRAVDRSSHRVQPVRTRLSKGAPPWPGRASSSSARASAVLSAAHALAGADADVTVIDRRNYHLFQPLLYQVATAGLSPAQIASPIRAILRQPPTCAWCWAR